MLKSIVIFCSIFAFVLLLMYVWAKVIDRIILLKPKFESNALGWTLVLGLIGLSTLTAAIAFFILIRLIVQVPGLINARAVESEPPAIAMAQCQPLIAFVEQQEKQISKLEDHRHIEEVAPIFTIKSEYEKGEKALEQTALAYEQLQAEPNVEYYTTQIAERLRQKADVFQQRIEVDLETSEAQDVLRLLAAMDQITNARLQVVNQIKKQCDLDFAGQNHLR
jgi:hypothetical protein